MPGTMRKFFEKPVHLIIFLPLLILVAFVAVNYFTFPKVAMETGTADGKPPVASGGIEGSGPPAQEQKPLCPAGFECCAEGQYMERPCIGGQQCLGNRCEKAECPFECCDDESSRAEYDVKACDGNLLCDNNKCVKRPCWKECCAGDPEYETLACPEPLECISNKCEKPACPDKYQCCPADDSAYRPKSCPGRGVCKFRVCRSG